TGSRLRRAGIYLPVRKALCRLKHQGTNPAAPIREKLNEPDSGELLRSVPCDCAAHPKRCQCSGCKRREIDAGTEKSNRGTRSAKDLRKRSRWRKGCPCFVFRLDQDEQQPCRGR